MLNIAFCAHDEKFVLKVANDTKRILKDQRIKAHIFTYMDANHLVTSFKKYQPRLDIILLEINMPSINGKEVARKLRALDKNFKLVFITNSEEEALNTFQYDINGFIPKQLIDEKLPGILRRVITAFNEDNPQTQVFQVTASNNRKTIIKIPLNDIVFFECVCKKVYLHTKRETFMLHGYKFSEIVDRYMPLDFIHNHRTCLVNIKYVFSINDFELCLDNGTRLPVSRRKKQLILNEFLSSVYCNP